MDIKIHERLSDSTQSNPIQSDPIQRKPNVFIYLRITSKLLMAYTMNHAPCTECIVTVAYVCYVFYSIEWKWKWNGYTYTLLIVHWTLNIEHCIDLLFSPMYTWIMAIIYKTCPILQMCMWIQCLLFEAQFQSGYGNSFLSFSENTMRFVNDIILPSENIKWITMKH